MPPVQRGDGKRRPEQTHTITLMRGDVSVPLLQITTSTSRHSSDNTQYYANKCLCDSGVAHTALLTADQPACIPYASLSAACLPLAPNIWLPLAHLSHPLCFTVCAVLYFVPPCSLSLSKSARFSYLSLSVSFPTPQSRSKLETWHLFAPLSHICSAR